jgi:hypothetical protein
VHSTQAVTFDSAAAQPWLRQPSSTDGFARAAAARSAPAHITRQVCQLRAAYQVANPDYAAGTEQSR